MASEVVENFLNSFQVVLTPKQKAIWQYLAWMSNKYRNVFPSHKRIAEAVQCSRDTVIEAIKRFKELGWLVTINKFWRSCVYYLVDELVGIDTTKKETFERPISTPVPTKNPTPSIPSPKNSYEMNVGVQPIEAKKEEYIHQEVKKFGLSWRDMVLISKYSLHIVRLAIEDYVTYTFYKHVRNVAAFLTSRCKHYCEEVAKGNQTAKVLAC